jgi:hypothetical protein
VFPPRFSRDHGVDNSQCAPPADLEGPKHRAFEPCVLDKTLSISAERARGGSAYGVTEDTGTVTQRGTLGTGSFSLGSRNPSAAISSANSFSVRAETGRNLS